LVCVGVIVLTRLFVYYPLSGREEQP
jgi:hypothetical protein